MNALARLMVAPSRRLDDSMEPDEQERTHREMLARRGASAFRNVGPSDLYQFPDRNSFIPDDLMTYLMFGQQGGSL